MSVFPNFFPWYGCDFYNALALVRKLENIKVDVHDMHNEGDDLSVDVTLTKEM